jgi:hypothetical protein
MKGCLRKALYGFWAWLIPFVVSVFFYSKNGLSIDVFLFKSMMVVVGSVSAAVLLVLFFRKASSAYLREGIAVGVMWLGVSIVLDLLILVPMSAMSIGEYFARIGMGYLAMPAMSIAVGKALENAGRGLSRPGTSAC